MDVIGFGNAANTTETTMKKKGPASNGRPVLRLAKQPDPTANRVFQLKITLNNVKPPIWRRVQVRDCTLATFHEIIQIGMGWLDGHLHVFEIDDKQFGDLDQWEDEPDVHDSRKLKLSQLVDDGLMRMRYIYDMGDGWGHTIEIEKMLDAEPGVEYSRCIAGERACPPEDCGGPRGYADLLEALNDPKHERHAELKEWLGRPFDAEAFDLEDVNGALACMGQS
jgi:hypothetical protein